MARRGRPKGQPKSGGLQKGYKFPATLHKEAARELLRQMVLKAAEPLVRAQVDAAQGIRHFIARNPQTGEFKRLTSYKQIGAALNAPGAKEGSTYWIYTKDPSTHAFTALMDRAIGRPVEEIELGGKDGGPLVVKWQD